MRQRLCALVYELLLLCALALLCAGLGTFLAYSLHCPQYIRPLIQICLAILMGAYFVQQWRTKGQTLAMKTWHLKITKLNGDALSRKQALVRYLFAWIWFVPPLALTWLLAGTSLQGLGAVCVWVIFWALLSKLHPDKQFWHDDWSQTRVVDTRQETSSNSTPASP